MMEKKQEQDKQNKNIISELPDSDFLFFLYSERDRENSLRQYQGWNIWALAGAIITVLCAGYYVIKNDSSSISPSTVTYFASGLIAVLLCYRPVSLFFGKERAVDYSKIKTVKDIAPSRYLILSFIVSISFSILILVFDGNQPWNIVSIAWIISAILFFIGLCYIIINKEKVSKSYLEGIVFVNIKLNTMYFGILGGILSVVWYDSFKNIFEGSVNFSEFELSICIVAVIVLLYLLIKVYCSEKESNKIDLLIDKFVYNGMSKEALFWELRAERMGLTVLESCSKELLETRSSFEQYEQKMRKIQEVADMLEKNIASEEQWRQSYKEINDTLAYLQNFSHQTKKFGDKLSQIEAQIPTLKNNVEFYNLTSMLELLMKKEKDILKVTTDAYDRFKLYICEKYGGFCCAKCEHRHEKGSIPFRIKRWCQLFFLRLHINCIYKRKNVLRG